MRGLVRRELIPEVVGGATEVVTLPETLEQPQLSLMNSASDAETSMGTRPDCSSQLEFAEGCKKCQACGYSECVWGMVMRRVPRFDGCST